ncbi:early nodulin-like protein 2 [Heracleum sosnowskyi]|uniref:Early nodulin-like protein 2 n=1 Tax=Heracleum sosnowskyi TaxID=360622 RepID=A0AAD8J229_9APIA|nr:early nodulin-like protein 2 [Heracleum sosnowskyi]
MFLPISFLVMLMIGYDLIGPSQAFKYYVGGKDGWSLKPSSKSFNDWASRYRFQVHDSLIFKYKNGTDSVLQVDQDHYVTCNTTSPILALENTGDSSTFNFNKSGLFFFISGHSDNCKKGQKVIILVMAPRNASPAPVPSPIPFQGSTSPDISPAASIPSPAASPIPQERNSPRISPAPSVPSQAASPIPQGPSQASPPDDGKSASAPGLGGDLVMLVLLLFWMIVY